MASKARAAHTPGPWHVSGANQIGAPYRPYDVIAGTSLLATVGVLTGSQHAPGEGLANARLIAAAPELLAALKGLRHACQHMIGSFDVDDIAAFEGASAAIAKAEGR